MVTDTTSRPLAVAAWGAASSLAIVGLFLAGAIGFSLVCAFAGALLGGAMLRTFWVLLWPVVAAVTIGAVVVVHGLFNPAYWYDQPVGWALLVGLLCGAVAVLPTAVGVLGVIIGRLVCSRPTTSRLPGDVAIQDPRPTGPDRAPVRPIGVASAVCPGIRRFLDGAIPHRA
jgi:hypothetical protein